MNVKTTHDIPHKDECVSASVVVAFSQTFLLPSTFLFGSPFSRSDGLHGLLNFAVREELIDRPHSARYMALLNMCG